MPSTSTSPSSLSLYTARSSSSLSSEPAFENSKARGVEEDGKLADIEYLVDVPRTRTKTRGRARERAGDRAGGCDHRLQRRHGGCRVCYECSLCKGRTRQNITLTTSIPRFALFNNFICFRNPPLGSLPEEGELQQ